MQAFLIVMKQETHIEKFDIRDFYVATQAEINDELAWSRSRVSIRRKLLADPSLDPSVASSLLTKLEAQRVAYCDEVLHVSCQI